MTSQLKILLVGPVAGQLTHLSNKLSTLQNSKAGPFDICLCAGPFFHNNQNIPSFPIPVAFVDEGDGLPSLLIDGADEVDSIVIDGIRCVAPNLYHLPNQADIISIPLPKRSPLTVGYCRPNIRLDSSCDAFKSKAKHTAFLGCDIFISSEWGQGIESLCGETEEGSYDVAELVSMCRPRYHLAPGLLDGETALHKFIASPPYRYSSSVSSHAGRFLALGHVTSPAEAKSLGKSFKAIHAVGITPLAYMDASERERAMEVGVAVANPYTDDFYKIDNAAVVKETTAAGGISEAQARRLMQQHSNQQEDFRWQSRKRKHDENDAAQLEQENNLNNMSLFLHGLHRDAAGALTPDVLMDAFRPFGCHMVRYPKISGMSSYVFLDFNSHDAALQCLKKVKGEVAIRNVMLTLKWSNPTTARRGDNDIPPPPPKRKQRLTEAEAADSSTLFLKLPPTLDVSTYAVELETIRMLAERTMEDELNIGIPADSPDRITASNEPALRVAVRQPDAEKGYGFLQFDSHTAALTTLISLTGNENGGIVNAEKLTVDLACGDDGTEKRNAAHLEGIALHWAKDSQPKTDAEAKAHRLGQRTDCWFCLASPTCEKHLIVAVGDNCYIAMPKGAINEFHALIVPIDHKHQGALVDSKLAPEIEDIKTKLRSHAQKALNKDLFVFERCIQTKGGYHTHIQCIPVDNGSGKDIQSKMMEMSLAHNFKLKEITSDLGLPALGGEWEDGYFYAEVPLPGGGGFRRFVYNAGEDGGTVPLQFGREVLAAVIGDEKISQWKSCLLSQEKEEELTVAFRKSLESV
jgi:diadenosine tetraphosphate (Ap4A) HIT family hydrolase